VSATGTVMLYVKKASLTILVTGKVKAHISSITYMYMELILNTLYPMTNSLEHMTWTELG